ncbi:MAG: HEAT repeat domain-containing protein [Alphaproteobacteria bacterium]|nr:HEAT repeat domain-containing protein [Alphaproteobacteria bacterium]MCB9794561.1 HEAT repeat domain-containing protein [Alphaproteobacteria bacterium]
MTPLERLARTVDHQTMLKKLEKRIPDREDQAALLWEGARTGLLRVASGKALTMMSRASAPYDAEDLLAALAPGPINPQWSGERWWALYNLHYPFKAIVKLVEGLEDAAPLMAGVHQLDGLLRCAVELGLAHGGFGWEVSEASRADFCSWSLVMSFPEEVEPLARDLWGESWLTQQAVQLTRVDWVSADIDWRPVSKPERFAAVWDTLPQEAAIALGARSYWDSLARPVGLLCGRADLTDAALLEAAEQWLARRTATGASYGGYGSLALFLALHRRGLVTERYYPLLDICMYGHADVPLIREALSGLSLEERERRALRFVGHVSWMHTLSAPTPRVVEAAIALVRGMKSGDRQSYRLGEVRSGLAELGQVAAQPLIDALSEGKSAPFDDVLIEALGALRRPEAGPVLVAALGRKATREAAAKAIAQLDQAEALALLEGALHAKKKDERLGAAMALAALPASPERAALAAGRLAKERGQEVILLLTPLV